MVHADATRFKNKSSSEQKDGGDGEEGQELSKEEVYAQVLDQARLLFEGQRNWVCNLANTASLLWHAYKALPSPSHSVNWAGFYTAHPSHPTSQLILGPFAGRVACQTIHFGKGVCGTAAAERRTVLVKDVEEFPGHIACDGESRSEIVVPVFAFAADTDAANTDDGARKKIVVAVIDVDCAVVDGFDEVDRVWLEKLADLLGRACDWGI